MWVVVEGGDSKNVFTFSKMAVHSRQPHEHVLVLYVINQTFTFRCFDVLNFQFDLDERAKRERVHPHEFPISRQMHGFRRYVNVKTRRLRVGKGVTC